MDGHPRIYTRRLDHRDEPAKGHGGGRKTQLRSQSATNLYCAEAEAMRRYLETTVPKDRINVLMCENDILAIGALDVIRSEFGLSVPADIAVVGFDDAAPSAAPVSDLTTYAQPIEEMVKSTIDMILGRRENSPSIFAVGLWCGPRPRC